MDLAARRLEEPSSEREVSLDEAMALALGLQKNGQLTEAETLYRRILEVAPGHADALHFAGLAAHQQGRSEEGAALVRRALETGPVTADAFSNLGIILKACGRLEEAVDAYQRALELQPAHANAFSNLGVALKALGRSAEAEAAYRNAIRINPSHVDAHHNLGVLLVNLKRTREAVTCFCRVTTLQPRHPETRRLLALAHCELGEPEKAVKIFEEWLEQEPNHPVAAHMLAACSGAGVPERASDAYVERVFDEFAASFDTKLACLSYQAPQLVAAMLADAGAAPSSHLDVLDAGCGTGLCGPLLSPYARRLTGVDLSQGMLDRARAKGVYDELVRAELTGYLRERPEAFDAIVSADTLVYFGALDEVCLAAAAALRPGGWLIFTVEAATDEEAPAGYRLESHGRYAHTRAYLEQRLATAGLRAEFVRAELRMESGAPVEGLVIRAAKAGVPHG